MDESLHATLHATLDRWNDFYLITGTAAAALTGLQFVVQTLIAGDAQRAVAGGDPEDGIAAFGTPTVVHFTLSLLISAVLCAPWPDDTGLRITLGLVGVGAIVYAAVVLRRTRRQRSYVPVMEDWVWHVALPGAAYAGILLTAVFFGHGTTGALFALAGATLLLICIGIHNAWDTVTYLTVAAVRSRVGAPPNAAPSSTSAPPSRGRRRRR